MAVSVLEIHTTSNSSSLITFSTKGGSLQVENLFGNALWQRYQLRSGLNIRQLTEVDLKPYDLEQGYDWHSQLNGNFQNNRAS